MGPIDNRFFFNFNIKGWSEIVYAYELIYLYGSFLDYVFKKIRILLEAKPALPTIARINLVVVGLLNNVREKLTDAKFSRRQI